MAKKRTKKDPNELSAKELEMVREMEQEENEKPVKSSFPLNDNGLINSVPNKILRRGDCIQYWLQQKGYPNNGTPNYKLLSVLDKMVIGMIDKATTEGNGAAFNYIMEHGFGRNTDGADISRQETNAGARFNMPMTVSELKEKDND